jgi:hypothetical protein
MSGGSFDYYCFHISQFAEELQNKIDENDKKDEYGCSYSFKLETLKKLQDAQKIIEQAGKLAKDIEWLYSGDIGEETFEERFEKYTKEKE